MPFSEQIYRHYWDNGWAVIEGVFSREEIDNIASVALSLSQEELKANPNPKPGAGVDRSPDGKEMAPRKLDSPFLKDTAFRSFVLDVRLVGLIRGFLGENPILLTDQILMKPPRYGSQKPYHQDNAYFRCHPDDQVITAWIALDDVDVANGCMRYIDGSHRGPIVPHYPIPGEPYNLVPPAELIDLSKESLAPVKKGGVVFHHSKTLHTSHRNETDRWRRGYATHWVTAQVTSENPKMIENAHFRKVFSENSVSATVTP